MSIKLKAHNEETYKKIQENFERSKKVAVIHPTGTGKSFLALKLLEDNKDKKAIYIAPSTAILHGIKKNIFDAGMDMSDFPNLERYTYQKLARLSDEEIAKLDVDIIILDEFHHCGAPEWGSGVSRLIKNNPNAQILGLSATPIRYFDSERDMAEELFENNIASEMSLEEAIDSGILPGAKYVSALYDFDGELQTMQDEIEKIKNPENKRQAQAMFENLRKKIDENTANLPSLLAEHMKKKNGKYIVFCRNIEDMKEKLSQVQSMFGKINPNIKTYCVSSKLHDNENTLKKFENDNDESSLKLMFAVDMLNEGYHINDLDGVIMMRPTYSPTIYTQQLGRALSVRDENNEQPVIIDLVNNFDSIRIIEDLCERLKHYKPTGNREKNPDSKTGLRIQDTTKEFRDIAKKITEISKRTTISLKDKIEIFERFFEQGNEDIEGQTIFEGYPIGQWAIQIRSCIKSDDNSRINLSEEQVKRLDELGILERRIDSTIDEKIDALIKWQKDFPDVIVERRKLGEPISANIIEKLKEIAKNNGVEFPEIEEKYKKMQSYKEYVLYRDYQGKLSDDQRTKCKEGNLGGRFGYPTEIDELTDKLKIDANKVANLITRYGSVDNFIQMYKNGKLTEDEVRMYNYSLFNNVIDMDYNPLSTNYSFLLCAISGTRFLDENEFKFFSSETLKECIKTSLTLHESGVIQERYGLVSGKALNLEQVGRKFNLTRERVRQIEARALRKLHHQRNRKYINTITINDLRESEYITDNERIELTHLENDILKSNLIFRHDSVEDIDFDKKRFDVIRNINERIKTRIQETRIQERQKNINNDTSIEELDFSVRIFSSLKLAGILSLSDIVSKTEEELMEVKNLRKRDIDEIISKLNRYGLKLRDLSEISDAGADDAGAERTEDTTSEKVYTGAEIEEIRARKATLEAQHKAIEKQIKQAEELLKKHEELSNTKDKAPNIEED